MLAMDQEGGGPPGRALRCRRLPAVREASSLAAVFMTSRPSGAPCSLTSDDQPPRKLKLESEDSSYDSDQEAPPQHEDVSRTVSDTLCAEFAEYVTTGGANDQPDYTARVEFACKLGYTEEHVQRALKKLGTNPGQNDFLEELIRVGKDSKSDAADEGGERTLKVKLCRELWEDPGNLRHVVVDGSNVAMSHGNKERFSCRGIRLAVDYFRARGHQGITVFVPMWRKEAPRPDAPITDQEVLLELERERILVFTPSRVVDGKRITCYDDRYILQTALDQEGIVVSNDNYRDLHKEKQFKKIIEERILMYSFANDRFMPPEDPLGRNGPTLDNFLRKVPRPSESLCPYGKKCTYGNKCKYYHPERGNQPQKSVTEKLAEHAQRTLQGRKAIRDTSPGTLRGIREKTLSLPPAECRQVKKRPVTRTRSLAPGTAAGDARPDAKSRSMENVASAARLHPVPIDIDLASYEPPALDWHQWSLQQQHVQTEAVRQHMDLCRKSSDPTYQSSQPPARAHKPLARQLTLNPSYDPRLLSNTSLLSPHWDAGGPQHASVTRIASAPDTAVGPPPPARPYPGMQRLSSSSDPQLNLPCWQPAWPTFNPFQPNPLTASLSSGAASQPPPPPPPPPSGGATFSALGFSAPAGYTPDPIGTQPSSPRQSREQLRRRMYWHLCALFPEEKVRVAMNLMPDETDPTKICAQILQPR